MASTLGSAKAKPERSVASPLPRAGSTEIGPGALSLPRVPVNVKDADAAGAMGVLGSVGAPLVGGPPPDWLPPPPPDFGGGFGGSALGPPWLPPDPGPGGGGGGGGIIGAAVASSWMCMLFS